MKISLNFARKKMLVVSCNGCWIHIRNDLCLCGVFFNKNMHYKKKNHGFCVNNIPKKLTIKSRLPL
jgi:hypothetical protein